MWELFSFRGRTGRLGYWRVQLLGTVLTGLFWVLGLFAAINVGLIGGLLFLPTIPIAFALLATWIRRLHDRGKGAWWILPFVLAPLALNTVAQAALNSNTTASTLVSLLFALAGLGISLWALVEVGFLRGQPGANRFGEPPPLGR